MAINDDMLRALGRLVVNFGTTELYFSFGISGAIGADQSIGQIVTSGMSFRSMRGVFSALIRKHTSDPKVLAEMEAIMKDAEKLEGERNNIIHSGFMMDDKGNVSKLRFRIKESEGLVHMTNNITPESVNKLADSLRDLGERFMKFLFDNRKQ